MNQSHYTFNELTTITQEIINNNHKLIYLAGASASGKSYIGEELVKQLTKSGKKVLLISSDSYYSDASNLKYMLYGTFDHPKLIDYDLLQSDIE
jgi:uridine kinase